MEYTLFHYPPIRMVKIKMKDLPDEDVEGLELSYIAKIRMSNGTTNLENNLEVFFFLRFYLFIHDTHTHRDREAETQVEGEAGSIPGARCRTRSRVSRITTWAEGRGQTAEPPRDPQFGSF